ncbi:MAG: hypothetical protein ACE5I8_12720, partial [Thermodesulfobacteriota bacterium]
LPLSLCPLYLFWNPALGERDCRTTPMRDPSALADVGYIVFGGGGMVIALWPGRSRNGRGD